MWKTVEISGYSTKGRNTTSKDETRMNGQEVKEFVRKAEEIYSGRLRSMLGAEHPDEFVVIEPDSGDFFLGKTLSEAGRAARAAYPGRMTHAMRVGHPAALHFGMHIR